MVRLYSLNINEIPHPNDCQRLFEILPEHRRDKIRRMRFDKDKRLSFGAGLLIKYVAFENGFDDNNISFSDVGKPVLDGLFFNISHSDEYVICAVGDKEVGCDIEKISEIKSDIAKRFFSKTECEYLNSFEVSPDNKLLEFFRIWTIKESYIKMTGEGISIGLDTFSVNFHNKNGDYNDIYILRKVDKNIDKWEKQECFINEYLFDGYCCSVCSRENEFDNNVVKLNHCELYDTITLINKNRRD